MTKYFYNKDNEHYLKLAAVAFETQNGMTITDKNHTILQVNKAFTAITGYEANEVIGKTPAILKSGIHNKTFYRNMKKSLNEKGFWNDEIQNLTKDGKIVKENLTIQSVVDDDKEVLYYVASFTDITLQKEIEERLRQKESMLIQQSKMAAMGEMLENIAHQWRQPLSLISSISSGILLKKEYGLLVDEKDEIKYLNQINDATTYLSQTIEDFRNFFKPNNQCVVFNTIDIYNKTLKLVNIKFKSLQIKVIKDIQDIKVLSFENELMQILINILKNAQDALETKTNQERIIFINIYKDKDNAIIKIKDNAGGIPNDIINKIFDPYFTTKHQSQGTGIGLYMSMEMITKHIKGTMSVKNETFKYNDKDYTGAIFTITVPLSLT